MVVKVVLTPCFQWSPKNHTQNDVVFVSRTTSLSSKLSRTRSFECKPKQKLHHLIRRVYSASFNNFTTNDIDNDNDNDNDEFSRRIHELALQFQMCTEKSTVLDEENQLCIEMKANCVDLPISLRMIKRKKKQLNQNLTDEAGETAHCSVQKAFSSMVFMIRELYSYSLHMRETLLYEDLQRILSKVHNEMHASFVWLFQQVFSHTPTLMVYIMILLANFTVHSMSNLSAFSTTVAPPPSATSVTVNDSSTTIDCLIVSDQKDEVVWDTIAEEANTMQGKFRDETLNNGVSKPFVTPVTAKMETDDNFEEYFQTELVYRKELAQEPNNVLLLANYAQFLHLVVHDYDRAEEYFKRAIKVEPKDAEAHCKYAIFLWQVRNDLWAAEETYLEAISIDPTNSFYAANYAHFLWNTGAEDTCFPLDDEPLSA